MSQTTATTSASHAPLAGKIALVTGGSRGLGAAIVRRLAADGAHVAFTYVSSADKANALAEQVQTLGVRALAIQADSARPEAVENAIHQAAKELGGLDILVNNAGVAAGGPIDQTSLEDFDRQFAVNVRGVFVAIKTAAGYLKEGGRIINIGSVLGDSTPLPGLSVYSATKSAVAGLTRGAARDLGPRGITVNNIQPGPIDTDMNPADGPGADAQRALLSIKRHGKAEEIAAAVSYLASPGAAFTTGISLNVDGGFNG
ncbi:MAG: 3-oxoacyl-ACP reductase family protein [Verrucomicrobiota bacterium JB022]|nr:3-oxoacyl-ACP reductase family protein [Verrucomicrobiota bacterium JB022]